MTLFTPEINKLFEDAIPRGEEDKNKVPLISPEMEKLFGHEKPAQYEEDDSAAQQYEKMPEYQKAFQAVDDLGRLFSTGATYGGMDTLGGPESRKLTDDARQRAGSAGMVSEFAGGLASPITRTIGAGAKALAPVGKGILNWLGRAAVTSGEGATIGAVGAFARGSPEDAFRDATWGAVLPHAVKAGGKAISFPAKHAASYAASRRPENFAKAFQLGRYGDPDVVMAFRRGIENKKLHPQSPRPMKSAYVAGKNLSKIRPSKSSIGAALSSLPSTYYIDPKLIGIALGTLTMGSPRLGGEVSHFIGNVLGGLDKVGSSGAVPALTYEQYKRNEKK